MRDFTFVKEHFGQGWAILDDFIAIPILGGQNCRELVKSKAPENFIGKNWSNIEKPKKELLNLDKMAIAIKEQFFLVHCTCLQVILKHRPKPSDVVCKVSESYEQL